GDRARCQSSWLGVTDQALDAVAELEADLGNLGGLAGTGLAGHNNDLVFLQGLRNIAATTGNRQLFRVADGGHAGPAQLLAFIQSGHAVLTPPFASSILRRAAHGEAPCRYWSWADPSQTPPAL